MGRFDVGLVWNWLVYCYVAGKALLYQPKWSVLLEYLGVVLFLLRLVDWLSLLLYVIWFNFLQIGFKTLLLTLTQSNLFLSLLNHLQQLLQPLLPNLLNPSFSLQLAPIPSLHFLLALQHLHHLLLVLLHNLGCLKLTFYLFLEEPLATEHVVGSVVLNRAIFDPAFRTFIFWIGRFTDDTLQGF